METNEFTPGTVLIEAERTRQIKNEGYTSEHDHEHDAGELADAAACYACFASEMIRNPSMGELEEPLTANFKGLLSWPWENIDFKPTQDPIRALVKAGALIAAEIDRLQRKG